MKKYFKKPLQSWKKQKRSRTKSWKKPKKNRNKAAKSEGKAEFRDFPFRVFPQLNFYFKIFFSQGFGASGREIKSKLNANKMNLLGGGDGGEAADFGRKKRNSGRDKKGGKKNLKPEKKRKIPTQTPKILSKNLFPIPGFIYF